MIKAENIILAEGKIGVAVYKSKRESGSAEMYISGLSLQNIEQDHLVEKNSVLFIDGQEVKLTKGNIQSLIDGGMEK